MADAVVRYQPQGPVLDAYGKSRSFVQVLRGPLGGGKTIATAFKVFKLLCQQKADKHGKRRSRVGIVRNTYPDLTSTTIRDWRAVVPEGTGQMTMGHPPEMKLDFDLPDGTRVIAEVIFIALDKEEHVRKLRGLQLTFAWGNEFKELPKAIIDMLTGRVDRFPYPGFSNFVGILGDTNAWDTDHYLEEWRQAAARGEMLGYEFFEQPPAVLKVNGKWAVNPDAENLAVLKPGYYERQIAGKTDDWIKVNLENKIGYYIDGRAVHPSYSDSLHGSDDELVPQPGVVRVGIDFGLTPAAAFLQQNPITMQWMCFDEIVMDDGDAALLGTAIVARQSEWDARVGLNDRGLSRLAWVFRGDPSGDNRVQTDSDTAFKVLRANGVAAFPTSTNDPQIRRDALDRALTRTVAGGRPGFAVSRRCKVVRKGLAGGFNYKRIANASGDRYHDVPDKNKFSHICEALEYAMMDAGEHAVVNAQPARPVRRQDPIRTPVIWTPFGT